VKVRTVPNSCFRLYPRNAQVPAYHQHLEDKVWAQTIGPLHWTPSPAAIREVAHLLPLFGEADCSNRLCWDSKAMYLLLQLQCFEYDDEHASAAVVNV